MVSSSHDSEILQDGQQVITACVFIHKNFDGIAKVFLPRRAATKKFLPGVYELPGGHIEFGEDIVKGLQREIREEFGLEITVDKPFAAFTYLNEVKKAHAIEVVYFATFVDENPEIVLNPEDHSEYEWLSKEEVLLKKKEDDQEVQAILEGFSLLDAKK